MSSKVCLSCADNSKLRFLPCAEHSKPISPADCSHDTTSPTITHNGLRDDILCHDCGILLIWSGILKPCLNCETLTNDNWGGYCHDCDNQLAEQEDN